MCTKEELFMDGETNFKYAPTNNYYLLAYGIISQAVEDYKDFLTIYLTATNLMKRKTAFAKYKEIETFFQSDWFDYLQGCCDMGVNGEILRTKLKSTIYHDLCLQLPDDEADLID